MHANLAIACAAALGRGALLGLLKHTWQYGAVTCLTVFSVSAPRPVLYILPRPSRNYGLKGSKAPCPCAPAPAPCPCVRAYRVPRCRRCRALPEPSRVSWYQVPEALPVRTLPLCARLPRPSGPALPGASSVRRSKNLRV